MIELGEFQPIEGVPGVTDDAIGFAVMGLGQLGLGQIVPAFKDCKLAKLTALVSGSPDKAKQTAEKFGVDAKNIYNYENFDKIKDNDQVVMRIEFPDGRIQHTYTHVGHYNVVVSIEWVADWRIGTTTGRISNGLASVSRIDNFEVRQF